MSLCPHYCDCPICEHGKSFCEPCDKCAEEVGRARHQADHEASVRRQQARLKIAPWKVGEKGGERG